MRNRADTLPLPQSVAEEVTSEVLTARALRRSLLPDFLFWEVAAELADLAGFRREPINRAIARIDRAQARQPSQVVEQAELALLTALDLIAETSRPSAA